MCIRYFGFVLLIWFPGALRAQNATQSCSAPRLDGGFFAPKQVTYSHGTTLTYTCNDGHKPAVKGWWAASTCEDGKWSHQPQCIDEKACFPPTVPNTKYTESSNGWYEDGDVIRITCDKGYEHRDHKATDRCVNGAWSSLPICEKSLHACSEPPKVSHAVVIDQGYQEVFAADSEVQYECEDGYTIEGGGTKQSIFCIDGTWTESPICSRGTRPAGGHGGSTGGGTGAGHTTSAGSGTLPTGGGSRPGAGHGTSTSAGSWTRPVGGGSSTGYGSNERETETPIRNCGRRPTIQNGEILQTSEMFLEYRCNSFFTRLGPQTVKCYTDGTWSEVPTCKAAYCSVDTDQYSELEPDGVKFIKVGEKVHLKCVKLEHWWTEHYSVARCTNERLSLSDCCGWFEIKAKQC